MAAQVRPFAFVTSVYRLEKTIRRKRDTSAKGSGGGSHEQGQRKRTLFSNPETLECKYAGTKKLSEDTNRLAVFFAYQLRLPYFMRSTGWEEHAYTPGEPKDQNLGNESRYPVYDDVCLLIVLRTRLPRCVPTVHGIGESLRGNAMDFVDSATDTEENRGHGAAVRGQQETAVGVNDTETSQHAGTGGIGGTTGYGSGGIAGTMATTTSTAPTAEPTGNVNATGRGAQAGVGTGTGRAGAV
ncbi:hypothetical protein BC629DRAFT_1445625 [Irpex lacteus]|nr:hypothetical protein BC629DRAFT_1445625 [Irpex lacteus]